MTIREKLKAIQTELKAPKNLYNKFGNYSYRNAEGICEAVKPFLEKYNVALVIWDEVIEIGGRIYVKAYARIMDCESSKNPTEATATEDYITATAYARECESKKGMDDAQITGATSSYARKYALNGLFLLDDTKDVDTEEYQAQSKSGSKSTPKQAPVNSTIAEALATPSSSNTLPFEI
jgi:hypothetical protein